jgi:hypothetical protein
MWVFCSHCEKVYLSGTATVKPSNRRKTEGTYYRHRIRSGHCSNHVVSGSRIEPVVWSRIVNLILDPKTLRQGYEQSLEQQMVTRTRQEAHLEELRRGVIKLDHRNLNLTRAYTDPDIRMTKTEYLSQRQEIEEAVSSAKADIEEIEKELAKIPLPEEFEALEKFAIEVRRRIANPGWEPTQEAKRRILELLHVKVRIDENEAGYITGWFKEELGFSSLTSACCERKPIPFSIPLDLELGEEQAGLPFSLCMGIPYR